MTDNMTNERVGHYLEAWKQIVTVQQHFNDIEWRIRGLALTAATFAIGAAAVAAKDGESLVTGLILLIGVILWYAFYFVDRYWYHPLLIGAVKQGHDIEKALECVLPEVALTKRISDESPTPRPRLVNWLSFGNVTDTDGAGVELAVPRRSTSLRSSEKLAWFYGFGAAALIISGVFLSVYSASIDSTPAEQTSVKVERSDT